ncbi:type II secretion system protein GspL [Pseudomonas fluorescens]|uniref:type II secretion system protein GspL n=1 Tax=Pseudomonas fluorescens TaxID=294 RepID=UPI001BE5AF1A|nr:type II secretion system protein GspL [Pseudomonas fluorescens]MBT2372653.1 type II secretion system protein GspL [Pseudomonas fluorescens]
MSRLRIALPPLDQLSVESLVQFVRLDRAGRITDEGRSSLVQLGQAHKAVATECFLHPRDSQLTSLELPQLPAAKVAAAVGCAAQALILGPIEQMHVAHGPRETTGLVQVGWLPLVSLEQLNRVLTQAQLKVRGLYPAPYALPVPAAGQLTVALVDEQLLLRHSLQQGAVHPLGPQALDELLRSGTDLHQVAEGATQRLSGTPPAWGLHGRLEAPDAGAAGWGRALALTALALTVWTLGLNLYAARQVDEGQRLKAHMSEQVKQAFPELSIILNPLQQARQQLAARQNGAVADPGQRFTSLLQLAGSNMPFMVGSVETLVFEEGRLHLSLLADSRSPAVEGDWQAMLAEAGFSATRDDQGWTLVPATEQVDADESAGDDDDEDEDE